MSGEASDLILASALRDAWHAVEPSPSPSVLVLGARVELLEYLPPCTAVQAFKPFVDALNATERAVLPDLGELDPDRHFDRVLIWPSPVRAAARAELVTAARRTTDDGVLFCAQHNERGARSLQADAEALFGQVEVFSKHRCRGVVVRQPKARCNAALSREWEQAGSPQWNAPLSLWTQAGVFAAHRLDAGSALLMQALPDTLRGSLADLGAGVGVLSAHAARHCPGLQRIDLYEADYRALSLAKRNLAALTPAPGLHWHDVTQGLPRQHEVILSNPPFHAGGAQSHTLGQQFLRTAIHALAPGGELWLVANRHLPYESLLKQGLGDVTVRCEADGYKVLHARKANI